MITKKISAFAVALIMAISVCACASTDDAAEKSDEPELSYDSTSKEESLTVSDDATQLADGTYHASFDTDSTMFHVNESLDGKGVLTVENGSMTIHIVMPSKSIVNLFPGTAEDAQKDGADLIEPTVEEIIYEDGLAEEVNAFDVPVPALDEEFDLALIGTKGTWYDHKVKVSNPTPIESKDYYADGEYTVDVILTGGSGKASVDTPATVTVENGEYKATIMWSSPYYDYMIVDGTRYEPINSEGNSVFEIPIEGFDTDIPVIADTTAMSEPHEIEYTLVFSILD